ncbi:hypothetical protein KI387_005906, partial [Taxus chinensis]
STGRDGSWAAAGVVEAAGRLCNLLPRAGEIRGGGSVMDKRLWESRAATGASRIGGALR